MMSETADNSLKQYSTYGKVEVGFGTTPAVLVVDFQRAFTDPRFQMGGSPLIERALKNTQKLLVAARKANVLVAKCVMGYGSRKELPYWKVAACQDLIIGNPECDMDPRIDEPEYDTNIIKSGPSIFFQTPLITLLTSKCIDTTIITGCVTSGCVRASIVDSFQHGYRTIVPEDCVGDHSEQPHKDNLRDVERRYADISNVDIVLNYLDEHWKKNLSFNE